MNDSKYFKPLLAQKREEFASKWVNPPTINSNLNVFDCVRHLGRGAFGRVLLVKHKPTSEYYALKILHKGEIVKNKQIENAINEKKLLAALDSPFIIRLAYSFKDNIYLYMALEFVPGGEMFTLLRNMRRFPDLLVKFYSAQIVLAFEYFHHLSIAYRDLKPENILLNADGFLKVADLGFSKILSKDKPRTWTVCGTPDYMAPEIITSRGYHWAVDWWAFGVLLYEMTAGFPPFMHQDQLKTFELIIAGKLRFTSGFAPELRDLIKSLIQSDLSRRYGNLKGGVDDIKLHKYFSDIDWVSLYEKRVKPPFKPKCKVPGDTSSSEKWDEEPLKSSDKNMYEKEFENF